MLSRRQRRTIVVAAAASTLLGAGIVTAVQAAAAAGCQVDYTITNSWQGGFGADVSVHNLGDPIDHRGARLGDGADPLV